MRRDDYALRLLNELPITEHGRIFLEAVRDRCEEDDRDMRENPHFDNENIKRDLRYRLGWVAALKWILAVPEEAANEQSNRKKEA